MPAGNQSCLDSTCHHLCEAETRERWVQGRPHPVPHDCERHLAQGRRHAVRGSTCCRSCPCEPSHRLSLSVRFDTLHPEIACALFGMLNKLHMACPMISEVRP